MTFHGKVTSDVLYVDYSGI